MIQQRADVSPTSIDMTLQAPIGLIFDFNLYSDLPPPMLNRLDPLCHRYISDCIVNIILLVRYGWGGRGPQRIRNNARSSPYTYVSFLSKSDQFRSHPPFQSQWHNVTTAKGFSMFCFESDKAMFTNVSSLYVQQGHVHDSHISNGILNRWHPDREKKGFLPLFFLFHFGR